MDIDKEMYTKPRPSSCLRDTRPDLASMVSIGFWNREGSESQPNQLMILALFTLRFSICVGTFLFQKQCPFSKASNLPIKFNMLEPLIRTRKIVVAGKGDVPDYTNGTKVCFYFWMFKTQLITISVAGYFQFQNCCLIWGPKRIWKWTNRW